MTNLTIRTCRFWFLGGSGRADVIGFYITSVVFLIILNEASWLLTSATIQSVCALECPHEIFLSIACFALLRCQVKKNIQILRAQFVLGVDRRILQENADQCFVYKLY